MGKLDTLISEVNGDLQDCLAPVRDRFRQAMSEIFDYAVSNPASTVAQAQTAIGTAFRVHYADGLVSPGITIEQALTAFNNRHGVGATAALKWTSIKDFIIERSSFKVKIVKWLEDGTIADIPSLWLSKIRGDEDYEQVPDMVYQIVQFSPKTGLRVIERYLSASLGKTIQITYGYADLGTHETYDGTETRGIA